MAVFTLNFKDGTSQEVEAPDVTTAAEAADELGRAGLESVSFEGRVVADRVMLKMLTM